MGALNFPVTRFKNSSVVTKITKYRAGKLGMVMVKHMAVVYQHPQVAKNILKLFVCLINQNFRVVKNSQTCANRIPELIPEL